MRVFPVCPHCGEALDDKPGTVIVGRRYLTEAGLEAERERASAILFEMGKAQRRYQSHCCQRCGAFIGWLGRFWQWLGAPIHRCKGATEGGPHPAGKAEERT